MLVPYEWIREFVDIPADPNEVSRRLTMIGLEVEGTASVDGDVVFEVNVTPNRPDCLSIIGIARELSAAFDVPLRIPPHSVSGEQPDSDFTVDILDHDLCNRYTGRVIAGVRIAGSPEWIRKKLEKCGIRSVNNVVDITNYVLLEFGHPLHAFDADLLKGKKVVVATPDSFKRTLNSFVHEKETDRADSGTKARIRTLDGTERIIPRDSLLIWDAENPVAVAGVMGGAESEVKGHTGNIFLESAYFDPSSVRKTSKGLGLSSESSYRFERGTDIEFLEKALDRAALLIQEIAGGTVHKIIDAYPVRHRAVPVEVKYERIRKALGVALTNTEMLGILKRLDIPSEDRGEDFVVLPPSGRRDIVRESDVAEEIARIFGYENIPTTNPRSPLPSGHLNQKFFNMHRIRGAMIKAGFTEAINFSFMGMSDLEMIKVPEADQRRKVMALSNPLSQDGCLLRTTLVPSLITNLKYNLDRGMTDIRLFEVARVFENTEERLPKEEFRLAGVFYTGRSPSLWKEDARGFFIAKGAIESLFCEVRTGQYTFVPCTESYLHAGQSADILVQGSRIGYLGVLGPDMVEKLDLKKQKPEIVVFEINLEPLLSGSTDVVQYAEIPRYPSVERDVAVVVDEAIPSSRIQDLIRTYPSHFIADVSVFDYFRGGNIPEGKKSLAYNIIYRSKERTLRDEEIEELHASIVAYIIQQTGGELRK